MGVEFGQVEVVSGRVVGYLYKQRQINGEEITCQIQICKDC